MTLKKADLNKNILILLVLAIVLGAFLIIYQQKIIRSLKKALSPASSERISVNLGQLGDKLKDKGGTFVPVSYDKDTLMGELAQIKAKLSETENLLKEARQEKDALKGENTALKDENAVLNNTVTSLKEENTALNNTIAGLKEELRIWEGKINNLDEKKLALQKRSQSIRELRKRVWDLKVEAQRQVDNLKMQVGNRGFLTKDGELTFSREKIVQLEKIIIRHPR